MDTKIDCDKVIGYLLRCCRKGAFTVSAHKLHSRIIRTANLKYTTAEVRDGQLVKPLAGVDGVKGLCAIQDFIKNSFGFPSSQFKFLYKLLPVATKFPVQD